MRGRATVVLDIGKTLSKAGLWNAHGELLDSRVRRNSRKDRGDYIALDVEGIQDFLAESLGDFSHIAEVGAIIPVAHGAAAALVDACGLLVPPLDYEHPIPASVRANYDRFREAFAVTGSPRLPDGLNLGAQLYYLESLYPDLFSGGHLLLPWPQYWSWLLSGVASSEITSLGCHTDMWRPIDRRPSALAIERGWAARLGPLRHAADVLGPLAPEWVQRTGLSPAVQIHCGLHDSNAALAGSLAFHELAGREATVLSTGTWFVAMRTPSSDASSHITSLDEDRDCLVNVDVTGRCIPSARFMGGREIELLDIQSDQPVSLEALARVVEKGSMVLPTLTPNSGPFPSGAGRQLLLPADQALRRAAACMYLALVADVTLELIGSRGCLLVEGRFSRCEVFVRALATLRPDLEVYVGQHTSSVSLGALRLLDPALPHPSRLSRVPPLTNDLVTYRRHWRETVEREAAA